MSLQDEHDIATKRPDVKEAYIKLTDAITGARKTPSTPQAESVPSGKDAEDREFNDKWHLASGSRESVMSGRYTRTGESGITGNVGAWYETACYWRKRSEELEAQTAALAAERDEAKKHATWLEIGFAEMKRVMIDSLGRRDDMMKEKAELERSNSLLRERITAAEGLLREVQSSAYPHPVEHPTMTKAWQKMAAYFSENKENQ